MPERIKVTVGCTCHNCSEAHGIEVLRPESAIEAAARKVAEAWENWLHSEDYGDGDLGDLYDSHYAAMQALAEHFKEPHRDA